MRFISRWAFFGASFAACLNAAEIIHTPNIRLYSDYNSPTDYHTLAFNFISGESVTTSAGQSPDLFYPTPTYIAAFSGAMFGDGSTYGSGLQIGVDSFYRYNFTRSNLVLGTGSLINSTLFVNADANYTTVGQWLEHSRGFTGFSFQESISSGIIYGWIEWSKGADAFDVLRFGFEDSGAAALVPTPIPESATIARYFGLLALAIVVNRRRNSAVYKY